ncbi:MAG TPA: hypothetical protein HPP77_06085 [Candidatus Hydrogenedentes bacterium]|nr:hypothetical protein [Candidatus Hydrogenedentota bacterium]HIJ74997.1 hypothetical protein [Candidatus Hydrogenedentota bacterium]
MARRIIVLLALLGAAPWAFGQEAFEFEEESGVPESGVDRGGAIVFADDLPDAQFLAEDAAHEDGGTVFICPIQDMIDRGMAYVVKRAVKDAGKAEAKALVFVMDTPGGLVTSALQIVNTILDAPCPTIVYIHGEYGAISAGAIISFACNEIVMAPAANIGAAAPMMLTPQGAMLPSGEKEVSFLRKRVAALAEENGHNPAIAEAMVDEDVVLYGAYAEDGTYVVFEGKKRPTQRAARDEFREALEETLELLDEDLPLVKELLRGDVEVGSSEADDAAPEELGEDVEVICARGKLLTLSSKEAIKYGLIPTTCNNIDEVLAFYGHDNAEHVRIVMTWNEKVFRFLTTPMVASALLLVGLICLYMEAKTPGFGVFGIAGVVCLALRFGAGAVLGITEWLDLALIVVGLGLIGVEIFVIPGFGIVGILGILCLGAGIFLSLAPNEFVWPEYSFNVDEVLVEAGKSMVYTVIGLAVFVVAAWKLFPHTPLAKALVLGHAQEIGAGYVVQRSDEREAALGLTGVAASMLRPVGRGRFGEKNYQVVARGEFIDKGTPIVIVQADGNRYVVEKREENA